MVFSWVLVLTPLHKNLRILLWFPSFTWNEFTLPLHLESMSPEGFIPGVGGRMRCEILDAGSFSSDAVLHVYMHTHTHTHTYTHTGVHMHTHWNPIPDKLIPTYDSCFHSDNINWSLENITGDKMARITNAGWEWEPFWGIIVTKGPGNWRLAWLECNRYFFKGNLGLMLSPLWQIQKHF